MPGKDRGGIGLPARPRCFPRHRQAREEGARHGHGRHSHMPHVLRDRPRRSRGRDGREQADRHDPGRHRPTDWHLCSDQLGLFPPICSILIRTVGAAIDRFRSRSSAMRSMPSRISAAVPAIVRPWTGKAILPFSIQKPDAPPLKLPLTGLMP
ncbi:MAG: hypothetical protein M0C28_01340 [Candidatus Moduliflexus flocculans]|nr:hypothetical protein [Candidatus Moduliflexus flocculans]